MSIIERLAALSEEQRRRALEKMPSFLATIGESGRVYKLLTTYDFLQAKMNVVGLEQLIEDYALTKGLGGNAENLTLQRIAAALRAGAVLLRQAPEELWNQVKGRANIALHTSHPRPVPRLDLRCATLVPADEALLHIFDGHSRPVSDCALSADGHLALSFGRSLRDKTKTLLLWDTVSGRVLYTLEGHTDDVKGCALSADGRLAFSASLDRTLRLWSTASGQEIARWTHDAQLDSCDLSANGRVAVVNDHYDRVHFFDIVDVARMEDALLITAHR